MALLLNPPYTHIFAPVHPGPKCHIECSVDRRRRRGLSQLAFATRQLQKNLVVWNAFLSSFIFNWVSGWNEQICQVHYLKANESKQDKSFSNFYYLAVLVFCCYFLTTLPQNSPDIVLYNFDCIIVTQFCSDKFIIRAQMSFLFSNSCVIGRHICKNLINVIYTGHNALPIASTLLSVQEIVWPSLERT